jgi:hypothetical protein
VNRFGIAQADRAAWQWQAAAELVPILDAHRDLPVIAWTVGPAGSSLTGHVSGLAPAVTVRATFDAWRLALALDEPAGVASGGGVVYLRAHAYRNGVRIGVTATVFDDEHEEADR